MLSQSPDTNPMAGRASPEALEALRWLGKGMPQDTRPRFMATNPAQSQSRRSHDREAYGTDSDLSYDAEEAVARMGMLLPPPAMDSGVGLTRENGMYLGGDEEDLDADRRRPSAGSLTDEERFETMRMVSDYRQRSRANSPVPPPPVKPASKSRRASPSRTPHQSRREGPSETCSLAPPETRKLSLSSDCCGVGPAQREKYPWDDDDEDAISVRSSRGIFGRARGISGAFGHRTAMRVQ